MNKAMTGDEFLAYLGNMSAVALNRERYQAALTLIRAGDQHRVLARLGRNTRVDDWDVMEAHETLRRCG